MDDDALSASTTNRNTGFKPRRRLGPTKRTRQLGGEPAAHVTTATEVSLGRIARTAVNEAGCDRKMPAQPSSFVGYLRLLHLPGGEW
jgi:hypothetical protein